MGEPDSRRNTRDCGGYHYRLEHETHAIAAYLGNQLIKITLHAISKTTVYIFRLPGRLRNRKRLNVLFYGSYVSVSKFRQLFTFALHCLPLAEIDKLIYRESSCIQDFKGHQMSIRMRVSGRGIRR